MAIILVFIIKSYLNISISFLFSTLLNIFAKPLRCQLIALSPDSEWQRYLSIITLKTEQSLLCLHCIPISLLLLAETQRSLGPFCLFSSISLLLLSFLSFCPVLSFLSFPSFRLIVSILVISVSKLLTLKFGQLISAAARGRCNDER